MGEIYLMFIEGEDLGNSDDDKEKDPEPVEQEPEEDEVFNFSFEENSLKFRMNFWFPMDIFQKMKELMLKEKKWSSYNPPMEK